MSVEVGHNTKQEEDEGPIIFTDSVEAGRCTKQEVARSFTESVEVGHNTEQEEDKGPRIFTFTDSVEAGHYREEEEEEVRVFTESVEVGRRRRKRKTLVFHQVFPCLVVIYLYTQSASDN